jgi:hypothetical protein
MGGVGVTGFRRSREADEGDAATGLFAWPQAFERRVDDSKIRRFDQLQEDQFEGQFEVQNGAGRGSCEPVPACVS